MQKELVPFPPLFISDTETRARLGVAEGEWPRIKRYLEGEGLPKKDPIVNKRFWPAVQAWLFHRYGISDTVPIRPDGKENWP